MPNAPSRPWLVVASGTLSVALVGVLVWAVLTFLPLDPGGPTNSQTTGPHQTPTPPPARPRAGTVLPGTEAEVISDLDGDVSLTSYTSFDAVTDQQYVWDGAAKRFEPLDSTSTEPLRFLRTSPDGRWAAGAFSYQSSPETNYVTLIDQSKPRSASQRIEPPDDSMRLSWLEWSPNGKHLLILVIANDKKNPATKGLLLVTPEKSLRGTLLPLKDRSTFSWLPDSVGFAVNVDTVDLDTERPDIEFYNLLGKKHDMGGEFPQAGWLGTYGYGAFSPDGKKLVTMCNTLGEPAMVCVYDMEQEQPVTFRLDTDEDDPILTPIGFYDDTHLIAELKDENRHGEQVVVLDLTGNQVDILVSNPEEIPLQFSVSP